MHRLRGSLSQKAEAAYARRDASPGNTPDETYAAGEAHAYADAADEVRGVEAKLDL